MSESSLLAISIVKTSANSEMKGLRQKGRAWYFDAGGKPRRWIALGTNQAAAMREYHRLRAQDKVQRGTIDAMLADYLANPRAPLAAGTLVNYKKFRFHLSAVFGHMAPAELTQRDVVLYLRRCPRKSARGEIALLSMAYVAWVEEGRLDFNPCFGVKIKLPKSQRTRLISDAEIAAVIETADERLKIAIELAYAIGLRISDLCGLRWADLQANVETQKTGARQAFEMTDGFRALLDRARALQARVGSLYVLCDRRGRQVKTDTLRTQWMKACAVAGVVDAHFHDLRAAGGTEVDRQGGDAQKFFGHKTRQTTEGYLRDRRVNVVKPLLRKA